MATKRVHGHRFYIWGQKNRRNLNIKHSECKKNILRGGFRLRFYLIIKDIDTRLISHGTNYYTHHSFNDFPSASIVWLTVVKWWGSLNWPSMKKNKNKMWWTQVYLQLYHFIILALFVAVFQHEYSRFFLFLFPKKYLDACVRLHVFSALTEH